MCITSTTTTRVRVNLVGECSHTTKPISHHGLNWQTILLKLLGPKILNFLLESPSRIAPKFNSVVEQCRTKVFNSDTEGAEVLSCSSNHGSRSLLKCYAARQAMAAAGLGQQ